MLMIFHRLHPPPDVCYSSLVVSITAALSPSSSPLLLLSSPRDEVSGDEGAPWLVAWDKAAHLSLENQCSKKPSI